MTDKELKKLSRAELLEMLLQQSKNVEKLSARLERAKELLGERKLKLESAGSIAEASLQLNGVFEAAQEAADQYMESIESLDPDKQHALLMEQREAVCKRKTDEMVEEARRQCDELREFTVSQCRKEIADARRLVQETWDGIPNRLEAFGKENEQYRDMIDEFLAVEFPGMSVTEAEESEAGCSGEESDGDEEDREADRRYRASHSGGAGERAEAGTI